ncbi:hypothetical protein Y695_01444 [Hydrogenophaga sp. T4]|nr:hypothetical protein Y695_01444 [Hydrogenophaga sp. T4]
MHAQLDALVGALGDAQQLDAVAQLFGVFDVGGAELGDALHVGLVELHRDAESDRAHERDLVRRIHPLDVEGRVGLGVAQALRLLEHDVEVQPLVAHLGQDEVGRAVDDAGDPLDAVGGEALAQRLDDGNATGHGRLKRDHHTLGRSSGKDLGAVHSEQSLVGCHHVLAGRNGFQHQRLGDAVATDQLDHDVDIGVGDHGARVVHHLHVRADDALRTRHIKIGHHGDFNATASAALDFFLVALQHVERAAAHGAYAQQAYLDRFHRC